jgi:hypothetical protein
MIAFAKSSPLERHIVTQFTDSLFDKQRTLPWQTQNEEHQQKKKIQGSDPRSDGFIYRQFGVERLELVHGAKRNQEQKDNPSQPSISPLDPDSSQRKEKT